MSHLFCLVARKQIQLTNKEICHWRKQISVFGVLGKAESKGNIFLRERDCAECGLFGHMSLLEFARHI